MNRLVVALVFALGLVTVGWIGVGFVGSSPMALLMTVAIAGVYLLGASEIRQFRLATAQLGAALSDIPQPLVDLAPWLARVPASLQHTVRLRIEGERAAMPGPALTPYLVGLLVMLGMLGTFLGMVVTFKGAVFALEGSADLQAMRAALAAPIKGLGLSFGTSVAGVATSAMLGLLSAISRRERLTVARELDNRIATVLRPHSLAHQRQETFKALQVQAHALPDVVGRLQALMEGLEHRNQLLNAQLSEQQTRFHGEVRVAYTDLAASVRQSLSDSLMASANAASQCIQPVVERAMAGIAQESQRAHQRVIDATQAQLESMVAGFSSSARTVTQGWAEAVQAQAAAQESHAARLEQTLVGFAQGVDQRSQALFSALQERWTTVQNQRVIEEQQQREAWRQALASVADHLRVEWQQAGAQTLAQQQAICAALEKAASDITEHNHQQTRQTLDEMTRLLAQSEALIRSRAENEAAWGQQQGERFAQMVALWRAELGALRDEEAARGRAAVERLGELQGAVAEHLSALGTALEAPMQRLMQTAAEVPQAAAGVVTQLQQEMGRMAERDQLALEEREALIERINGLLTALTEGTGAQREAMEALVTAATASLEQASQRVTGTLDEQASRAADVAAQVSGSAIELASLGESFQHGVQVFSAANEKLVDSLQRVETSLQQSMARSDEQLAYYVAQAREVIDLSITAQQGILEDLRRLQQREVGAAEGAS